MSFCCTIQRTVAAGLPKHKAREHVGLRATSGLRPQSLSWRQPLKCRSTGGDNLGEENLTEDLSAELFLLNDRLEKLQFDLAAEEAESHKNSLMLAKLVKKLEAEQKAWIKDCQEMDILVAKADALNSSEEEVIKLKERHTNMKLKVKMLTALLSEKEREVGALEEQLESVKLVGEMKMFKENAPQLVAAGSVAVDASVSSDVTTNEPRGDRTIFVSPENPSAPPPSNRKRVRGGFPFSTFQKLRNLRRPSHQGEGMNVPGVFIASAVLVVSQTASSTWSAMRKKIPKEVGAGIEAASFLAATVAIVSSATHLGH